MTRARLLRGGAVLAADGWRAPCDVRLAEARIAAVGPDLDADGAEVIEAVGLRVVPGFVDLHVHGAGGAMFEDGTPEAAAHIAATLAPLGTTALLATVGALEPEPLRRAVAAARAAMDATRGARILGIHLEGPFLNPACAGAQAPGAMRAPDLAELDELQRCARGAIRLVTLAPELPGALALIAALRRRGVRVALGHSQASAAQVEAAVAAGASHVTHLFNAMGGLHHRAPGLPGVALTEDALTVELIADGAHLDPRLVDLVWRCKPAARLVLVSDGVAAVGGPRGAQTLFGAACVVTDAVRRAADGRLAGSCLTLADAVRHVARWCPRLPLAAVLGAASSWAAASLDLADRAGTLAPGAPADLVLLDAELRVHTVFSRGEQRTPSLT